MATLVKILAAGVLLTAAFFYFSQRSMIFPAPSVELPSPLPPGVEKVPLKQGYALLLTPTRTQTEPSPLLIYTHGNAGAAIWSVNRVRTLRDAGLFVLLIEYPGYAGAPGKPSLTSIRATMLEAYDVVTARADIDANRVVAHGRSIGGGAVSLLAAERPVMALGFESTFTSLADLVAEKGMPSFLLRDRFDNSSTVDTIDVPVFVYHGTQDTLIPIEHGRRLHAIATRSVFVEARCGHNDCPPPWSEFLDYLADQDRLNDR
ncbi:MAG: alpha/beta hydrolase [Pseudomonadota bacterium]